MKLRQFGLAFIAIAAIVTALGIYTWSSRNITPSPESIAIELIKNSDFVGDPKSVQVRKVKEIHNERDIPGYCGETTYIARGHNVWTGWIPFVADEGAGAEAMPDDPKFDLGYACLPRKEFSERRIQAMNERSEEIAAMLDKAVGAKQADEYRRKVIIK